MNGVGTSLVMHPIQIVAEHVLIWEMQDPSALWNGMQWLHWTTHETTPPCCGYA